MLGQGLAVTDSSEERVGTTGLQRIHYTGIETTGIVLKEPPKKRGRGGFW